MDTEIVFRYKRDGKAWRWLVEVNEWNAADEARTLPLAAHYAEEAVRELAAKHGVSLSPLAT